MRFNYSRWSVLTWRLDLAKQGFNARDDLTAKKQVISSFSRGWSQAHLKIRGLTDLWCSICRTFVIDRPDLSCSPWFWPSWVDIRPDFLSCFCPVVTRPLTEPAVVIKLPCFGLCLLCDVTSCPRWGHQWCHCSSSARPLALCARSSCPVEQPCCHHPLAAAVQEFAQFAFVLPTSRPDVWQKGSRHNLEQPENNPGVATCQESEGGSVVVMECRGEDRHFFPNHSHKHGC